MPTPLARRRFVLLFVEGDAGHGATWRTLKAKMVPSFWLPLARCFWAVGEGAELEGHTEGKTYAVQDALRLTGQPALASAVVAEADAFLSAEVPGWPGLSNLVFRFDAEAVDRAVLRVLREPLYVPVTMPVLRLLETFRSSRRRAALVLDEFGGVAGVATVDDIIEGLIGELPDPDDSTPPAIARQLDGSWLIDGGAPVADIDVVLELDLPHGGETREFGTVGGLVMMVLGRLPQTGDAVDYGGARFIVERMDGRRVATVRARIAVGER